MRHRVFDRPSRIRPGDSGLRLHSLTRTLAAAAAVATLACSLAPPASAQICGDINETGTVTSGDALAVLRYAVGQEVELVCGGDCISLEARLLDTETALAETQAQLAQVQALLAGLSRTEDTLVLTGANFQVVDGTDGTAGPTNGLGNIIIGYNEASLDQAHSGSHNLVVGAEHEYSSFSGIVAGERNSITARGASVLGGKDNAASALHSVVCGGSLNVATGPYSAVGGGYFNEASGTNAAVSGGCENMATNTYAAVSGGRLGEATGQWSSVTGGYSNEATALYATVSGGSTRAAGTQFRWTGGSLSEAQ